MSKIQLDRMLELLKKPRDVSDRAYEEWTECEPECNHDRGREQVSLDLVSRDTIAAVVQTSADIDPNP